MNSHALLGMLLGFGRDNSWFYEWDTQHENKTKENFIRSLKSSVYEEKNINNSTPKHFNLPVFGIFGLYPVDKQLIKKYQKEQKKIKSKGRDEVDVAIEWLTR